MLVHPAVCFVDGEWRLLAKPFELKGVLVCWPKKLVEKICVDCHGAENFVKLRKDKDGWEKVIGEMIEKGAKGTDEEFDKVVEYLVKNFGKDKR